jgi:hypothetical protein
VLACYSRLSIVLLVSRKARDEREVPVLPLGTLVGPIVLGRSKGLFVLPSVQPNVRPPSRVRRPSANAPCPWSG